MTLTGKATDLGSGISYYQFSTDGNLTASSSGWISITNTTAEITQTYSVSANGTYYFYVKDAAGNITKKSVVINKIDKNVPTVDSLTATANSDSTFKLVINASDTGGSGLKTAYVTSSNSTKTYSFSGTGTITITDAKPSSTYSVYVVDNAGNKSSTKTVTTHAINYNINNTYWTTTLKEAISKASNGNTIKLVNNYTDTSSAIFNKNVTLNLNNKTLTRTGTAEPIQISSGANVTFTNGKITSNSVEYDSCVIDNNGTLTIESGTYESTSNQTRVLLNRGTLTMNGGTLLLTRDGWTIENRNIFNFNAGTISLQDNSGGTALYNSGGTATMTGGAVTSISYGLCVDGGSFKSTGGTIQKTGTVGSTALVRNTGSAYMYNTYVTAESSSVGNLANQTGKYNNFIYMYTEDFASKNNKGSKIGKIFLAEFLNNGQVFVTYYNTGYTTGSLAVWTTKDSQDDLEWIAPYYIQNQNLSFYFQKSNHKNESGVYRLHLYSGSTFIEGIDINVP